MAGFDECFEVKGLLNNVFRYGNALYRGLTQWSVESFEKDDKGRIRSLLQLTTEELIRKVP